MFSSFTTIYNWTALMLQTHTFPSGATVNIIRTKR